MGGKKVRQTQDGERITKMNMGITEYVEGLALFFEKILHKGENDVRHGDLL